MHSEQKFARQLEELRTKHPGVKVFSTYGKYKKTGQVKMHCSTHECTYSAPTSSRKTCCPEGKKDALRNAAYRTQADLDLHLLLIRQKFGRRLILVTRRVEQLGHEKTRSRLTYKCSVHGEFKHYPDQVLNLHYPCPKCSVVGRKKSLSMTLEQYKDKLKAVKATVVVLGATLQNSYHRVGHECLICSTRFKTSPQCTLYGNKRTFGCPNCLKVNKRNQSRSWGREGYIERLAEHYPRIRLIGEYVNVKTKAEHKCLDCKNTWMCVPDTLGRGVQKYGCPACGSTKGAETASKSSKSYKRVVAKGRKFTLQGYEPQALQILLDEGFKIKQIRAGRTEVPTIKYRDGSKTRHYFPDIHIPSHRMIVEVKSTYTLGYRVGDRGWNIIKRKREAVRAAGYRFRLMLMRPDGREIEMPKKWWTYSKSEIRGYLRGHH